MKQLLLIACSLLLSAATFGQSKDCKFETLKDGNGKIFQVIKNPGKVGNLFVGKAEGKVVATYSMRNFYALFSDDQNMTQLVIDSVKFIFDNNAIIRLKAIGFGKIKNTANKLTYYMQGVSFSFMIENEQDLKVFRENKVRALGVHAEKDGQFGDIYDEKQQTKLQQAFICLQ